MSAAAHNRGSRIVARDANARMPAIDSRVERQSLKDEIERLRAVVSGLERELSRARRCLASERHGREELRQLVIRQESAYAFAVGVLCRRAFPLEYLATPLSDAMLDAKGHTEWLAHAQSLPASAPADALDAYDRAAKP